MRRPALIAIAALVLAAVTAWAWPVLRAFPNPFATITAVSLRDGAYVLKGGVANTGFVVGDKGVIAIDTQLFTRTARNAVRAIARVTSKPITTVVITHSDPDHINGLPTFPAGVKVIAHANAATQMKAALESPARRLTAPPAELKDYLPTLTIDTSREMVIDGVPIALLHIAPAHTNGDLVVYLPRQKIVFAGDMLTPSVGQYPGIHLEKGGSSLGWIATAQAMLALDADRFVSGHGDTLSAEQLKQRIAMAIQRRADIEAMVIKGMTLPEIKTALRDPAPTGEAALFPTFTETTYQELTEKQ